MVVGLNQQNILPYQLSFKPISIHILECLNSEYLYFNVEHSQLRQWQIFQNSLGRSSGTDQPSLIQQHNFYNPARSWVCLQGWIAQFKY